MIVNTGRLYQTFKYAVYLALAVNTGHFFIENFNSAGTTYENGVGIGEVIVAYTDAIDTAAWLILLLLLELETFVLPDDRIKAGVEWTINILNVLCGGIILYALYGYWATLWIPLGFVPYAGPDLCGLIGGDLNFALDLDEFVPLDAKNCVSLAGEAYVNAQANLVATSENLSILKRLAWTDVLNASVWVIIVAVLEAEVYLQSSKLFGTKFFPDFLYSQLPFWLVFPVSIGYAIVGVRLAFGIGVVAGFLSFIPYVGGAMMQKLGAVKEWHDTRELNQSVGHEANLDYEFYRRLAENDLFRGGIPERSKGADCKSAGLRLRRFESFSLHHFLRVYYLAGVVQW